MSRVYGMAQLRFDESKFLGNFLYRRFTTESFVLLLVGREATMNIAFWFQPVVTNTGHPKFQSWMWCLVPLVSIT